MRLNTAHMALLGLAILAGPSAQAATPAASAVTAQDETVDTRLFLDSLVSPLDAFLDTRLNIIIYSPEPWATINTLKIPGTLLLVR